MVRVSSVLLLGVLASSLAGCRDSRAPSAPSEFVLLGANQLSAPATIALGSSLTVVLTVYTGSCLHFDHIDESRRGATITLAPLGIEQKDLPPNTACTSELRLEVHSYQLDPPFPQKFDVVVPPSQFGASVSHAVTVQ
jgi:hypothetical protein